MQSSGNQRTLVAYSILGLIVLVGCGAGSTGSTYRWDWGVVGQYLPQLLDGLGITFLLSVGSLAPGVALGLAVAAGRLTPIAPLRFALTVYVEFARDTPVIVQLVWIYYALPVVLGVNLPGIAAVIIALTFAIGGYYAEAFRGGIQGVSKDLVEAADVLGLNYLQRMMRVILPEAFRSVLPDLMSATVNLVKDTSLVSVLGVADLMYQGNLLANMTYRPMEILTTVALMYFAVVYPLSSLSRLLERRVMRHQAVMTAATRTGRRTST